MVEIQNESASPDLETTCDLLDKLVLIQLHLIEEKIEAEMKIENTINTGTLQFAKARYITGHSSISATKLPIEGSPEFAANVLVQKSEEDTLIKYDPIESDSPNRIDPLKWFGVLVPNNLRSAQKLFKKCTEYVVDCVNAQLALLENMDRFNLVKQYKCELQDS